MIQQKLQKLASKKTAERSAYFFKTEKGQYGHGDVFIGVKSPDLRALAKNSLTESVSSIRKLVQSKIHEERMLGLMILVYQYKKTKDDAEKNRIYKLYVSVFKNINNWDLVDCSCPHIVGPHLLSSDRSELYEWARSDHLWTKRIAIVSNWWFIRQGDLRDVFKISRILLTDEHDLIHKAVGWMLREAGKKDVKKLEAFIKVNYHQMPRTMLRYAIEKFPETKRKRFLKGTF
ncbi:DNA alkylation repair protein [Oligoflexaceae bacterium]|nr:DNA alkylation repair protein [Oligoflexaceae bacterium]